MEQLNAIYTKVRECQDCHKCIRECPVKAIRVEDGYAKVVPELCIMCGNCVLACPNSAKQVRDDLPSAKALLASGRKVIASLAPSFVAQFPGVRPAQLIHALKRLGFFAVSETALGAQQVSAGIARADEPRAEADLDFFRLSSSGGFHRQVSSRMPTSHIRRAVATADALQDAACVLWRRHCDRLYRALHRQEEGGRTASRASRCGAHVRGSRPLADG